MRVFVLAIILAALIAGLALSVYGHVVREVNTVSRSLIIVGYTFFAPVTVRSSVVNSPYTVFSYKAWRGS